MRATDGALLIVALAIMWSMYRTHSDPSTSFNLMDLVMENGRLSRLACAFMATLVVTSWVVIRLTQDGKATEGIFIGYGAMWVAPIIAKMFGNPPVSVTTIDTQSHEQRVHPKEGDEH